MNGIRILISIVLCFFVNVLTAQNNTDTVQTEKTSKIKFGGFIQAQYQYGQKDALLNVGATNETAGEEGFSRIGLRRARLRFTYTEKYFSNVYQVQLTEKGVELMDAYFHLKNPWIPALSLRVGIFDRPFGYEVRYATSQRESPERSRLYSRLFNSGKDLGAMLVFQMPETHPLHMFKLEAGLIAGNGVHLETDSKRDFVGRLGAEKKSGIFRCGGGVSYYNGYVYNGSIYVNEMKNSAFVKDSVFKTGTYLKREYIGFDAQVALDWVGGTTSLRSEYIWGKQPGLETDDRSPNYSSLAGIMREPRYQRPFNGFYTYLIHEVINTPLTILLKYDIYDPNSKISGDDIGPLTRTNSTDLKYTTLGCGLLWNFTSKLRLQAYYEFIKNEITPNIEKYTTNLEDNVFTLRLQYVF